MNLLEIIDRLKDCAQALDKHATEPYRVRDTANFLRATAVRIQRDADLERKVEVVKLEHDLQIAIEDLRDTNEYYTKLNEPFRTDLESPKSVPQKSVQDDNER